MRILGLTILPSSRYAKELQRIDADRGWISLLRERYPGAWQRNDEETIDSVLRQGTVFACQTLIASDIAKVRCRIVELQADDTWKEAQNNTAHSPVLRRPNHFQNRIQFFESWMLSKLSWGNAYILKARDERNVVKALYPLDPQRVAVLVSERGDVFYELRKDSLSRQTMDTITIPASEIIHDRFNTLFHPLVGLSPLFAALLDASQSLKIKRSALKFWQNGARPSGVLTAPKEISATTANELKAYWETNFSGNNEAKLAILGDGMKYEQMSMKSVDAQLVEQLGVSGKEIAAVYHVPAYKVGAADPPSFNNIEALERQYYQQCLQIHYEQIEASLDDGLDLPSSPRQLGTEFDIDEGLLRMDTSTLIKTMAEGVKGGLVAPNEGRRRLNYSPVEGGDSPYLQQQNYSLEALAKRDAQDDPFKTGSGGGTGDDAEVAGEPDEGAEPADEPKAAANDKAARAAAAQASSHAGDAFLWHFQREVRSRSREKVAEALNAN